MARDVLILLPPSEGKAEGGTGPVWHRSPLAAEPLGPHRSRLVAALRDSLADPSVDPAHVLRYGSPRVLERAVQTDLAIDDAPTLPALERYTGVVVDGLDRGSLSAPGRRRLEATTWFVSGLWGLVAATDPIPDYRLKSSARVPGIGTPATWWRPHVSAALDTLADSRLVWNLLTNEHGRMWRSRGTAWAVATVVFTTVERGTRGVSNHHGKHLKGRFVRHLVETDPADLEVAAGFRCDGWSLDPEASRLSGTGPELVFTR